MSLSLPKLITSITICELAGIIGSLFTADAIQTWYATLVRPEFAPPNWVFGPVWTLLFALMGIAAYLVYEKGRQRQEVKVALTVFAVQLGLNVLWSIIFFGLQDPGLALAEILVLWVAIVVTMVLFRRIYPPAGWLLVPYILWVSFALYLNYAFWMLNKDILIL